MSETRVTKSVQFFLHFLCYAFIYILWRRETAACECAEELWSEDVRDWDDSNFQPKFAQLIVNYDDKNSQFSYETDFR
jgi:hypothetical protein